MKFNSALLAFLFLPVALFAQVVVDSPEYHQLKTSGQLQNTAVLPNPVINAGTPGTVMPAAPMVKSTSCDCYVEPDSTYTLAMLPNDDGSTGLISIPFDFCMYGNTYNAIYINNNGNLTFTGPLATFSATAFPSTNNVIVAPFWADVDTRGGNGQVLYKITPTAVYVNWVEVGYYSIQGDKLNTFQVTITDGTDPAIESGNVAFCYKDMQWTTGSASQGVNGFGGIPATAGANKGDGISYFLISRFDHPGNDFDGALGNPDGISWMDYKSFAFDVCNVGNVPPIPDGVSSCDTFKVCAMGDTADISIDFLSPEANQTTSVTYTDGGLTTLQEIANISGNTAHTVLRVIGDPAMVGYYTITVTATDDAAPTAGVTTLSFVIQIDTISNTLNPILTPLAGCDTVTLSVLNGPYDTYLWDDLSTSQTNGLGTSQDFGVTVSIDGCYKRVHEFINIMEPFTIGLPGPFSFCPPDTAVSLSVPNPAYYDSISWGLADPAADSLFTANLGAGTYTLHLVDSAGMCSADTTFSISTLPDLVLQDDDATCDPTYVFTTNTGGGGSGTWSALGNPPYAPSFTNNDLNTTVTFLDYGVYSLMYTDASCGLTDTVEIVFEAPPAFNLDADFFVCPGEEEYLYIADSSGMSGISWGITPVSEDTLYAAHIGVGTYTSQLISEHGCTNDTTFTITTQPQIQLYEYDHVCGDSIEFDQHLGIPTGQWTYYDSPGTVTFRNAAELNTGLDVSEYGVYHLVFTELTCQNSDTIELNFIPYIGVDLNDSMELCVGQVVEIPSNIYYPEYTDAILWNTGATTSTISANAGGYYWIEVSNTCNTDTDSIFALMRVCDIELPNVFTPGNDPVNGGWHLINPQDIFKEFHCVITNRWGNVVFEFDSYDGSWYGLDQNGNEAAEGVYFYTITSVTIDDKELNKQGFIHLER